MKNLSTSSDPSPIETVVSFNCRIETGEKVKVILLGVDEKGRHYDFADGTAAIPLDELHRVMIKAKQHDQAHYRKVLKGKGL